MSKILLKKCLSLLVVFSVVMSFFVHSTLTNAISEENVPEWIVPTNTANGWGIKNTDPYDSGALDLPFDGIAGDGVNVTSVNNEIVITKPSGDNWPCVTLKYTTPINLDMTTLKFLHYSLESNSPFKIAFNYIYDQMNTPEEGWKKRTEYLSKLISGADNDNPAGIYISKGVEFNNNTINADNVSKFQIYSIDIWLVGKTADNSDCKLIIRDFGIGDRTVDTLVEVNAKSKDEWVCNWPADSSFGKIEETGNGIKVSPSKDQGNGGYNEVSYQYNSFTSNNPALINLNNDMLLDYSLCADNGFNISFLLRNPRTGKFGKFKLNNYLAVKAGENYSDGLYGDNMESSVYDVTNTVQLKDIVDTAINNNDGEVIGSDWNFTVPDDGIVEMFEIRVSSNWTGVGEGTLLRTFNLRVKQNEKKILSATIDSAVGIIDEANHTVEIAVPYGTDIQALEPNFTVSSGAKILEGGLKDFTNPQIYTVQSENGEQQEYKVIVKMAQVPQGKSYYQLDLQNTKWTHTEGDGITFSDISWDATKQALSLNTANPGNWANVDSTLEPVLININEANTLHFDIVAGNGWDVVLFFKNNKNEIVNISVNDFISKRDGKDGIYYTGEYKDALNIRDMIKLSKPDYVIPDDGNLTLTGARLWCGYNGEKNASIDVKHIVLDDPSASHTIGSSTPVEKSKVLDYYSANLKGPWAGTGEGDIIMASTAWDESKGALALVPATAGNWTNVDYNFAYGENILLNINKAKYLHFDITSGNGWSLVIVLKDNKGNKIALDANNFISKHLKGMDGIHYTGIYKEALPLAEMIEFAKTTDTNSQFAIPEDGIVQICGLRVWIGYHSAEKSAEVDIRTLAFDDATASNIDGYKVDKYSSSPKAAWTPINTHWVPLNNGDIGIGSVGYDAKKGGLLIVPNKEGTWTQIDYNFAYGEDVNLNLNKATHLHFNISAGNGWDFQMLFEDKDGQLIKLSANKYYSKAQGKEAGLYKGDYDTKLDIKDMITKALEDDKECKFKLPSDGVVKLKEFRIWIGYHGGKDNATLLVKKLFFNNEAGTNIDVATGEKNIVFPMIVIALLSLMTLSVTIYKRRKA